jgi:hypothetical protein
MVTKTRQNIDYMLTPDVTKSNVWWILWYNDYGDYIQEDEFRGTEEQAEARAKLKQGYLLNKLDAYLNFQIGV